MRRLCSGLVACLLLSASVGAEESPAAKTFPASWVGHWTGPAQVVRGGQTAHSFPMELDIRPLEDEAGYTWKVVYGAGDERRVRNYTLLPVQDTKDRFRIDENNGIVLECWFENETLHNRFWVADNVIEARYQRRGETLETTLTTFGAKPMNLTGGKGRIPEVANFALRVVQRATLTR